MQFRRTGRNDAIKFRAESMTLLRIRRADRMSWLPRARIWGKGNNGPLSQRGIDDPVRCIRRVAKNRPASQKTQAQEAIDACGQGLGL